MTYHICSKMSPRPTSTCYLTSSGSLRPTFRSMCNTVPFHTLGTRSIEHMFRSPWRNRRQTCPYNLDLRVHPSKRTESIKLSPQLTLTFTLFTLIMTSCSGPVTLEKKSKSSPPSESSLSPWVQTPVSHSKKPSPPPSGPPVAERTIVSRGSRMKTVSQLNAANTTADDMARANSSFCAELPKATRVDVIDVPTLAPITMKIPCIEV